MESDVCASTSSREKAGDAKETSSATSAAEKVVNSSDKTAEPTKSQLFINVASSAAVDTTKGFNENAYISSIVDDLKVGVGFRVFYSYKVECFTNDLVGYAEGALIYAQQANKIRNIYNTALVNDNEV